MSKPLQWVIGVGVILMVLAVVFSSVAPYVLPRMMLARAPLTAAPQRMTMPPGFMFGLGLLGLRFPFFRLFGLTACVWPLLIVGLIILSLSLFSHRPAPPPMMPPAPPMPAPPASLAVCAQCGQPLQAGWRHCPSCGTPLAA